MLIFKRYEYFKKYLNLQKKVRVAGPYYNTMQPLSKIVLSYANRNSGSDKRQKKDNWDSNLGVPSRRAWHQPVQLL